LTKEQAEAIKRHREDSGRVLGFPGGPPHFGRHMRAAGGPLGDVAKALGITERKLFSQLRDGKTLAQVAKAQGKSLDDVRAAVKAAERKRIEAAVKDGKLTRSQADEILEHLDERLDHLGEGGPFGGHRFGGPPPGGPGAPGGFGGPRPPRWD
ncbi:MAG: hypothetical protein JW895_04415, partial [Thermoleophilaceae bacterium]|nr:hypothetical protein [Thermoleophilaceae bacterium]